MAIERSSERRLLLWIMMLSSFTGVAIWYGRRLADTPAGEWFSATAITFSYFTTFTNSMVVVTAAVLLFGSGRFHDWLKSPPVLAALCLYIAFVGLGFWFLLGGPGELNGLLDWIPEITAHSLSPILGAVFFVRAVPKGHLKWHHPVLWLSYPIAYLIYWLFRGPLVGYYPYFFVDVNALGYGGVAIWSGALIVAFLILGSLMLLIDRISSARTARAVSRDAAAS